MAFTVLLHPEAAKSLEKIEKLIRPRIIKKLKELGKHTERIGKRLKYSDFWSLRVGDYHAIYEINSNKKQVIVLFIGHRKNVYDDFSKMF